MICVFKVRTWVNYTTILALFFVCVRVFVDMCGRVRSTNREDCWWIARCAYALFIALLFKLLVLSISAPHLSPSLFLSLSLCLSLSPRWSLLSGSFCCVQRAGRRWRTGSLPSAQSRSGRRTRYDACPPPPPPPPPPPLSVLILRLFHNSLTN